MKYVAAYALLVLGGNASPSAADLERVLKEAGAKSEADRADSIINALKDKQLHELIAEGKKKMSSMGTVVSAPAEGGAAGGAPAAAKAEEKPKEEDADVDMGGLFGDDY